MLYFYIVIKQNVNDKKRNMNLKQKPCKRVSRNIVLLCKMWRNDLKMI